MADNVLNIKCPNCGAPLNFSPHDGEVVCQYCDSTFKAEVLEKLFNDSQEDTKALEWGEVTPGSDWGEGEENTLQVYSCPSCGAEIICDENTVATTCVYCGNPTVLNGRLQGSLKPDYIIPFRKTKEDAIAALKDFYKGKCLLPKVFSKQNHIEEIKGVYVPFWLFDSGVDAKFVFDASRTSVLVMDDEDITTIEHYRAEREGSMRFEKIPVDGSNKMEDRYMDAIEPFNYEDLIPFSRGYLPGYLAEKYDVDAAGSVDRVSERIFTSARLAAERTLSYDEYSVTTQNLKLVDHNAKYALLPVWMLTTRWKDETFMFAMNGQTGRLIGDLPVSKGRAAGWFGGITGVLFVIFSTLASIL